MTMRVRFACVLWMTTVFGCAESVQDKAPQAAAPQALSFGADPTPAQFSPTPWMLPKAARPLPERSMIPEGFAARAKRVRPNVDCLLCGRETGFMPAPDDPTALEISAVVDEKGGVVVTWSAFEGAEAYELTALRARGDETPMPSFDATVMGTSTTLSDLAEGWRWTFVVVPWVAGELVGAAQGESEPLAL